MGKNLPPKVFFISLFFICLISLVYIGAFYYVLNGTLRFWPKNQKAWSLKGPVTSMPSSFNLDINQPDDGTVVFDGSILVSGKTAPGAIIIITTQNTDTHAKANNKGEFAKVLNLSPGLNNITISAFDASGNSESAARSVYLSEEKL